MNNFFLFLVSGTAIAFMPGPSNLFALSEGLKLRWKGAFVCILGLVTGNAVYGIMSIVGLGAILISYPNVLEILKMAGIFYLSFLVFQHFKLPKISLDLVDSRRTKSIFLSAFVLALSNPAFLVFYLLFIPQFINKNFSYEMQLVVLSSTQFIIDTITVLLYVCAASYIKSFLLKRSYLNLVNNLSIISLAGVLIFMIVSFFQK